jgi:hypothetical protein
MTFNDLQFIIIVIKQTKTKAGQPDKKTTKPKYADFCKLTKLKQTSSGLSYSYIYSLYVCPLWVHNWSINLYVFIHD